MQLKEKIITTRLQEGEIALFYLAQAGFVIKTSTEQVLVIDAYLSDAAERLFGFKRMVPAVIQPSEIDADLWLSTHEHIDHLDLDAIPVIAMNEKTNFVGAPDCAAHYRELGISDNRCHILEEGQQQVFGNVAIRGIYADHGELAPEALGFLLEIDGINIYHTGDTCFRPEEIQSSLHSAVDIMIAPINGQFGNMNAEEACRLAEILQPKYVIASHFWMFLEHVCEGGLGDPAFFLRQASKLSGQIKGMVMAPGELFKYKASE